MNAITILTGDNRKLLSTLPDESVQCCVTSPPYWGLRDYGHAEQIGLEATPAEYVASLVAVFEEVRRVLRADGTLWLNLGDSYARMQENNVPQSKNRGCVPPSGTGRIKNAGMKPKDLVGIPWMVAFALREAGWWLRSEIIWHKLNPMPESVTDRPTSAHEKLFLLAKSETYYYDHGAIKESVSAASLADGRTARGTRGTKGEYAAVDGNCGFNPDGRNKRNVWSVASAPYPEAHFATYPPALITPCILAGTKPGDVVLDPFGGSGTTGKVALELGRRAILIELNPDYAKLIEQRTTTTVGFGF